MVGGNGPNVTWRLAAKHADELNLDGMSPADVAEALPVVRSRCEEIGRDPATLPISVHIWTEDLEKAGAARVDRLAGFTELGVSRVMGLLRASARSDDALESLVEDARAAGVELESGAVDAVHAARGLHRPDLQPRHVARRARAARLPSGRLGSDRHPDARGAVHLRADVRRRGDDSPSGTTPSRSPN